MGISKWLGDPIPRNDGMMEWSVGMVEWWNILKDGMVEYSKTRNGGIFEKMEWWNILKHGTAEYSKR